MKKSVDNHKRATQGQAKPGPKHGFASVSSPISSGQILMKNPEGVAQNYRWSHVGSEKSFSYSRQFRIESDVKWLYWQLEQEILSRILSKPDTHRMRHLDFACGTGRIISHLEERFKKSTGIDISHDMLSVARKAIKRSTLICGDVTDVNFDVAQSFDVITSFRFFLNAQSELRTKVLRWLYHHLNDSGILICNFHLNPTSFLGLYYRIYSAINNSHRPNTLSIKEAKKLLSEQCFKISEIYPYGYFFYKRSGVRFPKIMLEVERKMIRLQWLPVVARNFIVVGTKQ